MGSYEDSGVKASMRWVEQPSRGEGEMIPDKKKGKQAAVVPSSVCSCITRRLVSALPMVVAA